MNIEPPPETKEETDVIAEKCATPLFSGPDSNLTCFSRVANGLRQWAQVRGLNKDEERYFSEDCPDDNEPVDLASSPSITSSQTCAISVAIQAGRRPASPLASAAAFFTCPNA